MPKYPGQLTDANILAIYDHALEKNEINELEQLLPHTSVTQRTDHAGQDLPRIYGFGIKDLTFAPWRVYAVSNPHVSELLVLRRGGLIYAGFLDVIREAELAVLLTRYEFIVGCAQAVDDEKLANIDCFHNGAEDEFAAVEEHAMIQTMINASYRLLMQEFDTFLNSIKVYPMSLQL